MDQKNPQLDVPERKWSDLNGERINGLWLFHLLINGVFLRVKLPTDPITIGILTSCPGHPSSLFAARYHLETWKLSGVSSLVLKNSDLPCWKRNELLRINSIQSDENKMSTIRNQDSNLKKSYTACTACKIYQIETANLYTSSHNHGSQKWVPPIGSLPFK